MAVGSLAPSQIHRQPVVIDWFSELYLEELSDVIASSDMDCQTDAFLDKPATPLFIPAKTGKDVGTQVEEGEVGDPTQELWPLLWKTLVSNIRSCRTRPHPFIRHSGPGTVQLFDWNELFTGFNSVAWEVSKQAVFLRLIMFFFFFFSAVVWLWQGGAALVGGPGRKGNRAVFEGSDGGGGTGQFESSTTSLWRASKLSTGGGAAAARAWKTPQGGKSRATLQNITCIIIVSETTPYCPSQLHPIVELKYCTLTFHGCFQEHRIAQQREVLKRERETVQKIAARAYAQQYLSGLLPSVLTSLRTNGYFHDPVERGQPSYFRPAKVSFPQFDILVFFVSFSWFPDIESNFLPWLMSEVNNCLEKRNVARQLLDSKTQQHILTFYSIKMQQEEECTPEKLHSVALDLKSYNNRR